MADLTWPYPQHCHLTDVGAMCHQPVGHEGACVLVILEERHGALPTERSDAGDVPGEPA
jgi:hypothetical protein